MASEERKGSPDVKTSKKGGTQVKALTAEEEARRREIVKEKLREKLGLEERALKVVERLVEDGVAEDFLIDCAKFITPLNYKDAIEERSITNLCGYPACSNELGKIPNQKYKISTKTNKVYDITERKCFCSNFCYKASKEFELQISNTPLWVRQHEILPEITLMKKGDGGSSGEEVLLSERRVEEGDIEDPPSARSDNPDGCWQQDVGGDEQEQEFVSSVVSQQGPRVHWGSLPKCTDGDVGDERRTVEGRKTQMREDVERRRSWDAETKGESLPCRTGIEMDAGKRRPSAESNVELASEEEGSPAGTSVDEATSELRLCTLSETVTPAESARTLADRLHSPSKSRRRPPSTAIDANRKSDGAEPTGLNVTQVGVSKRGAAGLRMLLESHAAGDGLDSIGMSLLKRLEATFKDWRTDATVTFLFGCRDSLSSPFSGAAEEKGEELDEDDLDDEVSTGDAKIDAAAPDLKALRKEAQREELRVGEFSKGILPEEVEEQRPGEDETFRDQNLKNPLLPLIHSHSQHLIQKRIAVEKLSSCLRSIVGPLRLTISDVSTDLNNLVRTFRLTNKNVVHKTPEWMLISVVLLHLLSEVSPVVHEALETPASEEYLNALLEELGLREQELLTLVRVFRSPAN
ncbi:putative RNA polymerase II subunit B1 CTD phosphatase rpap2 isoform X2 [Brachionichthys hirsutus]|uniref:putative RNA polymerase II subunit B1 CTD phosphatase rpap2 isoform X2 n=1 Tax=Brachionichthys hirsutus TaxID=412623 RepID=UPI0036049E7B